jgi:hypothetical protein
LTQQLTSPPRKKTLDEASFQQLLAAAYVLQQHNELPKSPSSSPHEILSEVVRIQRLIRGGHSNLVENAKLIAEQAQKFTGANGAAIGIVTSDEIIYLAANGSAYRDIGLRLPRGSSLASYCIQSGQTLRSLRSEEDPRLLFELCYKGGVKSLIAVPVDYEDTVVAVLEARFRNANAFRDEDVRTCELMAGLVKEVIAQAGQPQSTSQALSSDQADLQEASPEESVSIDIPQARLPWDVRFDTRFDEPAQAQAVEPAPVAPPSETPQIVALTKIPEPAAPEIEAEAELVSPDSVPCRGCGQSLTSEELFCGSCGTERVSRPDRPLQSKWASLWYMNQARKSAEADEDASTQKALVRGQPKGLLDSKTADLEQLDLEDAVDEAISPVHDIEEAEADRSASYAPAQSAATNLATSVRLEWLPEAATSENWLRHQWRVNRANFYLAGAALLLIVVLSGWGTTPAPDSRSANSAPQLTVFERILVSLGIAEAPATPVYLGNPDTPVWVDLHTALYYCPGADLYGKTEGGKIATQRSAQLDQFEPAHRKACN